MILMLIGNRNKYWGYTVLIFLLVIEDDEVRNKIEEIYHLHNQDLFYVAYNILKDYHEAEDVVQTTILKLADHLDKIPNIKDNVTKAFVVMIARNIAKNIYNRRKSREVVPIEEYENILVDETNISPEQYILRLDNGNWVAKQLTLIKPEYADVLTMRYTYEYSNKEIAKLIEISEGNVRIRLLRAKKALHKIIGGDEFEQTS
jgi:RNA polymerase sigma-70 factor (ECF subfamily)